MMGGWRQHRGLAVALARDTIDTDQLIPARFMATPRSAGYGQFLLHDMRFDADGHALPDFPLNRFPEASILVTGPNFGSGSSREAAVYALADFGIKVIVAPSFGDIFAANAVNNGLLPAQLPQIDTLLSALLPGPQPTRVDLEAQSISVGEVELRFEIDPSWQEKLINGWDDIDLTRAYGAEIAAFRAKRNEAAPWAFNSAEIKQ